VDLAGPSPAYQTQSEDTIVQKLRRYRRGRAKELGLTDLLTRALAEAGLKP